MAARLYQISEDVFCTDERHNHRQQTRLAVSPNGAWQLQPFSSTPEAIALVDRPYYLFARPYGLYHPDLCNVLPSLRPLLFPDPPCRVASAPSSGPIQTTLSIDDARWVLRSTSALRKGFLLLPRELREMVFGYLVDDINATPAYESTFTVYDHDTDTVVEKQEPSFDEDYHSDERLVVVVDSFGRPDYRTLRRRCPRAAGYLAFLENARLADEAERVLFGSQEIAVDSRGLARFLQTRRAQWVKQVVVVVGLWCGRKTDAGEAIRMREAQGLVKSMMALSSVCTQLASVKVEACFWDCPGAEKMFNGYTDSRMAAWDLPEADSKYRALAEPLLHLERIGLLNNFLVRLYGRVHAHLNRYGLWIEREQRYVLPDYLNHPKGACDSFDIFANQPYEPAYESLGTTDHDGCNDPDSWYYREHFQVRYGPGAVNDPHFRNGWICNHEMYQEYAPWAPIYSYRSFSARHWVQLALRQEVDLMTAKNLCGTDIAGSHPYSMNYVYGHCVLHSAIRALLATETEPFDYPRRQRGTHGNFVMASDEPLTATGAAAVVGVMG